MATTTGAFLTGVGTTFAILAVGFGSGLIITKSALEPPVATKPVAQLPPVRVVLPGSAEAATLKEEPLATVPQALSSPTPQVMPTPEAKQAIEEGKEKNKQAERVERRKAEAEEREHRKRVAEGRARRDARVARQREEQQQQQRPGIMAFDDEVPKTGGFFGN
jgi:hypothetical protein